MYVPEIFWLKLMALDAHNDGLMSINSFPINLRREKQKTEVRFLELSWTEVRNLNF